MILEQMSELEHARRKAEAYGFALMTAAVYNVHRKKGRPAFRPSDFIRKERRYMSVEEARSFMDRWAARQNERAEA